MNTISRVLSNLSSINPATLSGAVDIVMVEQPDGTFLSTPFHVRFGKIGVVWSGQKQVDIEINGVEIEKLWMILDDYGIAFFPCDMDLGLGGINSATMDHSIKDFTTSCAHTERNPRRLERQRSRHMSDPNEEEISNVSGMERSSSDPDLLVSCGAEEKCKTLRLSKEQLKEINLVEGGNSISFSITTKFQGTARCNCNIFVWGPREKIVISDIDGTITRSDVRGQICSYTGVADWAHCSVAPLFSLIASNGYRLLYLSARPATMAAETKAYLESLKQDNVCLPPGPLFLNPESSLQSLKREVIDKQPEVFKISCMSALGHLFANSNPFWTGYGNKSTDLAAYQALGIPDCKIFLINKSGDLRTQVCLTSLSSSYSEHCSLVDHIYPSSSAEDVSERNHLDYWKDPLPDISTLDLDML